MNVLSRLYAILKIKRYHLELAKKIQEYGQKYFFIKHNKLFYNRKLFYFLVKRYSLTFLKKNKKRCSEANFTISRINLDYLYKDKKIVFSAIYTLNDKFIKCSVIINSEVINNFFFIEKYKD